MDRKQFDATMALLFVSMTEDDFRSFMIAYLKIAPSGSVLRTLDDIERYAPHLKEEIDKYRILI